LASLEATVSLQLLEGRIELRGWHRAKAAKLVERHRSLFGDQTQERELASA
jgi:hypothetical protein